MNLGTASGYLYLKSLLHLSAPTVAKCHTCFSIVVLGDVSQAQAMFGKCLVGRQTIIMIVCVKILGFGRKRTLLATGIKVE